MRGVFSICLFQESELCIYMTIEIKLWAARQRARFKFALDLPNDFLPVSIVIRNQYFICQRV